MKTAVLTLAIAAVLLSLLAAQSEELTEVHGVIEAVNPRNGWYGIVQDDDRGTRYAPDRLPDDFKKDRESLLISPARAF